MKRFAFLFVLAIAAPAFAQPVDTGEVMRYGDSVEHISGYDLTTDAVYEAMAVPSDDSNKFHVTVLTTPGCAACIQLKEAFGPNGDPTIRALAMSENPKESWAHLNFYDAGQANQSWRGYLQSNVTSYPWVVVQPPRSGIYGDATKYVWQGPYNGNSTGFVNAVLESVRVLVQGRQPQPQPQPMPQPVPQPAPIPLIPNVVPQPAPAPPVVVPPVSPQPILGSKPQIFVVTDPRDTGALAEIKVNAIKRAAEWAQEKWLGDAKAIAITYQEAVAMGLPVVEEDTPSAFFVQDGKVRAYITASFAETLAADPTGTAIAVGIGGILMGILSVLGGKKVPGLFGRRAARV